MGERRLHPSHRYDFDAVLGKRPGQLLQGARTDPATRERMRAGVAADGREVLEACQRVPYDIILMDVQMPDIDGLAAARRLRAAPPPGPRPWIIALTANAMEGDREQCLAAGMDDYLSKPVRGPDLAAVLERAREALARR